MWVLTDVAKAPGRVFDSVFVHPKPEALDVLPIIMFACANSLKSIRSVRARNSTLVIPRIGNLQVQVSIYLGAGKGKEMRRHSLEWKQVFATDLEMNMFST